MGNAEAKASLDATLLVVGQGVLVDALARRLSAEGIEVIRAGREGIAEIARVSAPDLILLGGDSVADGGSRVLETLAAGAFAGAQPVVVIGGASLLALGAVALRSNVATLVPEGGLDVCAQRVRKLLERLADRGLEKQTLQAVVDEITRGAASEPVTAVTVKQTSPGATGAAAPKRKRSPTLVGVPVHVPASRMPALAPVAAGESGTGVAVTLTPTAPSLPARSKTIAKSTEAAVAPARDAVSLSAAHAQAAKSPVTGIETKRAVGAEHVVEPERVIEPVRRAQARLLPPPAVGEVAAGVPHVSAPSAEGPRTPAALAETVSPVAHSVAAVSPFGRTMLGLPESPRAVNSRVAAIDAATEPMTGAAVMVVADEDHAQPDLPEPEVLEFLPATEPPPRSTLHPAESRSATLTRAGRALLRSALASHTAMRVLARRAIERGSLRQLSASRTLLRSRVARSAITVWAPVSRVRFARPRMLAAGAVLLVGAAATLAVVARGGRTVPSAAAASLAGAVQASSQAGPKAGSPSRPAASAPPLATQIKDRHSARSNAAASARQTHARVAAQTPTSVEVNAAVDETSSGEQDRSSKGLRPDVQRKLERANRLVDEGHGLLKRGHLGLAEAAYMKALAVWPDFPRALAGLTRVHLQRKDGSEAVRWAKRLVAKEPKSGQNQLMLGDAWALRGDAKNARAAWLQAVRYANSTARKRLKEPPTAARRVSRR